MMQIEEIQLMTKNRLQVYDEDGCPSLVQALFYEPAILKRWDAFNPLTFHVLYFDGSVHKLSAFDMNYEEDVMKYAEMAFSMLTVERSDIKEQLEMKELKMKPSLPHKRKVIEQLDWVTEEVDA